MPRSFIPLLLLAASWPALAPAQSTVLDTQFGSQGLAFRPEFGSGYRPIGACPHPNGSITVVGSNEVGTTQEVVITRLLPDGSLDFGFSGDGIHRLPGLNLNLSGNMASACSGLATPEPSDDRLTVFTSTHWDIKTFQVDLDLGQYAGTYCAGMACAIQFGQTIGVTNTLPVSLTVRGLQPGADGHWLLTGQYRFESDSTTRGFLFRFSGSGTLDGFLIPELPNTTALELANAWEQEGVIRFLAVLQATGGFHVASARTDAALSGTLLDALSAPFPNRPTIGKGRFIGNQMLAAPLLLSTTSPALALATPGQLRILPLPTTPMGLGSFPNQSSAQTIAATAGGPNGVLVSGALQDGEGLGAGIYVARVDLRGGTPRVDADFGELGASRITWQPPGGGCLPGENAHVDMGTVVSWQQANIVLGTSRTACPWSGDFGFLAMRVVAAPLLSDGFE